MDGKRDAGIFDHLGGLFAWLNNITAFASTGKNTFTGSSLLAANQQIG